MNREHTTFLPRPALRSELGLSAHAKIYRFCGAKSTRKFAVLVLLLVAAGPISAPGSGTYPPVVPARPPAPGENSRIDTRTYEAGRRVFSGRMTLMDYDDRRAQRQRPALELWQSRIPAPENSRVNLSRLSGRLSDYQFRSLEYFLAVRFKIRTR